MEGAKEVNLKASMYVEIVLTSIPHACARSVNNSGTWTRWAPDMISSPTNETKKKTQVTDSSKYTNESF